MTLFRHKNVQSLINNNVILMTFLSHVRHLYRFFILRGTILLFFFNCWLLNICSYLQTGTAKLHLYKTTRHVFQAATCKPITKSVPIKSL